MEEVFYDEWELGTAELQTYFMINCGNISLVLTDGKKRVVTPLECRGLKDAIACAEGLRLATMDGRLACVYRDGPLQDVELHNHHKQFVHPRGGINFERWHNRPDRVGACLRAMARDGAHFNTKGWY